MFDKNKDQVIFFLSGILLGIFATVGAGVFLYKNFQGEAGTESSRIETQSPARWFFMLVKR